MSDTQDSAWLSYLCALSGASVYVCRRGAQLELSLSGATGDPYEVTRADVDQALRVEALLEPLAADLMVHPFGCSPGAPPRAGKHCFSVATAT